MGCARGKGKEQIVQFVTERVDQFLSGHRLQHMENEFKVVGAF